MKKFFPECCKGEYNPSIHCTYNNFVLSNLDYNNEDYLYRITYELGEYYSLAKDYDDLVRVIEYHNDVYGTFDYNMEIISLKKDVPDVTWDEVYSKDIRPKFSWHNATIILKKSRLNK